MLTLLEHMPYIGTLIGFIVSFTGKYIKASIATKTNLLLSEQKLKLAELQATTQHRLDIDKLNMSVQTTAQMQAQAKSPIWINGIRAMVRPVVTYLFVGTFVFIKIWQAYHGAGWDSLWDTYTQTIFSIIIGFWFGERLMEK